MRLLHLALFGCPGAGTPEEMNTVVLDRRDASRVARGLVAADCASAAVGRECVQAAVLITSEVVTNAVLHGAGRLTFGVRTDGRVCRVEVGDDDAGRPRLRAADEVAEGGRGMLLVDALASDWGVVERGPGKVVWFEVAAQP